jgi:hypothetical protein
MCTTHFRADDLLMDDRRLDRINHALKIGDVMVNGMPLGAAIIALFEGRKSKYVVGYGGEALYFPSLEEALRECDLNGTIWDVPEIV